MKCILPLVAALFLTTIAFAQNPTYSGTTTWDATTPGYAALNDSGFVGGITNLNGNRSRVNGVTYTHTNRAFNTIYGFSNGWLTQFNDLVNAGAAGNNADIFSYQGVNTISGRSVITFDNASFSNGAANNMNITNHTGVYVFGESEYFATPPSGIVIAKTLSFNNSITSTNRDYAMDGAIVFVNNAGYTNSTSVPTDAQHVDGFVTEYNDENTSTGATGHGGNFTFPVGNSSAVYQLVRSGSFTQTSDMLTVAWVDGDPDATPDITGITGYLQENYNNTGASNLGGDIASVASVGFWDWHYQSSTDENYMALPMSADQTITVSIPDLTGYSGSIADNLRLVGWNANISKWINLGVAGASGLTKGSTLTGTIPAGTTITALAIGSTSIILPVTFTEFTVKAKDCKALLEWKTSMEQNNNYFRVEHSSDGIHFSKIGQTDAVGNSNTTQTYNYTDEAPLTGVNYYRITQVDFNGKYSSTPIASIQIKCAANAGIVKAYPNPTSNQLFIKSGKAVAQVNILSSNGQNVLRFIPSTNQGGTFPLNVQMLQGGIYLIQVVNKDGTADIIKMVKK